MKLFIKIPLKIQIDRVKCFWNLRHRRKVHAEGRRRRDVKLWRLEVELEVDVLILVESKLLRVKAMLFLLVRCCGLHGEWRE